MIIHEVSDIVSSIAAAIEEQSTVTKDIARNIAEASTGVGDANKRVAETSQATAEIAREIAGVDQAAAHMAEGSEQVRSSATELSKVAEQLQTAVSKFRVARVDHNDFEERGQRALGMDLAPGSRRLPADTWTCPVATVRARHINAQFGKWSGYGEHLSGEEKQTRPLPQREATHTQFHEAVVRGSAVCNLGPEGGGGERDEPGQRIHPRSRRH